MFETDNLPDLDYLLGVFSEVFPDRVLHHFIRKLAASYHDARIDKTGDSLQATFPLPSGARLILTYRRLPNDMRLSDPFQIVACWWDAIIIETNGKFQIWTTEEGCELEDFTIVLPGGHIHYPPGADPTIHVAGLTLADTIRILGDVQSDLDEMVQPGGRAESWPSLADFLDEMRAVGRFILKRDRRRPRSWLDAVLNVYDNHAAIPDRPVLARASERTLRSYTHRARYPRFDAMMDALTLDGEKSR